MTTARTADGDGSNLNAQATLVRLATGYRLSQMLNVIARLGIADLLDAGPQSCEDLAQQTGSHASSLRRALRALAGAGVFAEQPDGRFALTPLAEPLRSSALNSVRGYAIMQGEPWIWDAWGQALHSVRTGEPAFVRHHGTDIFSYLRHHPNAAATFNAGMSGRAASADVAIARAYDFSEVRTIVDVGGGHGLLLTAILEAWPSTRGILLDVPAVAAGARENIASRGLADRCDVLGGDFFVSVPAGHDCYVLANVIHDWDDDHAVAILRRCHAGMARGGCVLIVESVLPPGDEPHPGKIGDLQMLVITGGRERTLAEYHDLLEASGFQSTRLVQTGSSVSVVEGRPATAGV